MLMQVYNFSIILIPITTNTKSLHSQIMARRDNEVYNIFRRLLETNNPAKFEAKFTGNHRDVLPFIFEIDKFVKVNGLSDVGIRFRRVFNTLDLHYQNLFMEDQARDAELTIELLKAWLIKKYPPPPMKHEFLFKLKSIKMRKNEDPKLVFDKFRSILHRIDAAINYINENREQGQVAAVTKEQAVDALSAIFIRNNNKSKFGNDGQINKKLVQYIGRKNPKTYEDWKTMFKDMETNLIPACFKTLPDYQFIPYQSDKADYDIYKRPGKQSEDKLNHKITGKESGKKRKRKQTIKAGNKKRKYTQYCGRCGRNNHPEAECVATRDVFGKSLRYRNNPNDDNNNSNSRRNNGNKFCKRCKRNNHYTNECHATYYADHTPIKDTKFKPKKYRNNGNNDNNYQNNQNTKEFHTRKRNEDIATKDLMALLSQRISNDEDLDADQKFECMTALTNLDGNMSARHDK